MTMHVSPILVAALLLLAPASALAAIEEEWSLLKSAQSQPRQVIRNAEQTLRRAQAAGDKAAELAALHAMSTSHQFLYELETVKEKSEKGIALARELKDKPTLCWLLGYRALSLYSLGALNSAAMLAETGKLFEEGVSLANQNQLGSCLAWINLSQGRIFNAARHTSESLASASSAYGLFEDAGDRFGMAAALNDVAAYTIIRNTPQDAEKVRKYLDRAASLIDPDTYRLLAAENHLLRGHNEYFLQNRSLARASFEKAASIARNAEYFALLGVAERELAELSKADKRYAEALSRVELALPLVAKHPEKRHYIKALLLRAEVLLRLGKTSESAGTLSTARAALSRIDDPSSAVLYYSRAAEIYSELGNFQEAFTHLDMLRKVDQRLDAVRNQHLADAFKVRFGVELTESENARLMAERQEAEIRRLALTLGLALTVVVSVGLIGGLGLYMRKRAADTRKEVEHQKQLAAAEAEANHAKSEFLANMSHELRSPLNTILGFSRLVVREPALSNETRNNLQIVVKSGEHLYHLINQILDLSKIEAGRMTLNETVFDLPGLLDELEQMFSLTASQKQLALTIDRAPDLPRHIRADAGKLRQILINLLSNALKFTHEGGVSLHITRDKPGHLAITVTDTGLGIDAEELSKLGKAFVQAREGKRTRDGTGLGLAISNRFVQLMGGELKMASVAGQGSSFSFDMRIVEAENRFSQAPSYSAGRRVIALMPGQQSYRILAVDDLSDQRRLLAGLLAPLGFDVREASNGAEAIEIWKEWKPHLIWMDMRMPVLTGEAATRRIKATENGKSTIIIALTASSFEDERDHILAAGCNDFLRKPFEEQAIFDMLHQHLGVEFRYEGAVYEKLVEHIDRVQLASLPAALRERLGSTLIGLDVEGINRTIDEIRNINPDLSEALAALAASFDYEQILALLPARDAA